MIRNQFIHQVEWSPEFHDMAMFGLARVNETKAAAVSQKFGDPHVIIFRCTGKEAPDIQKSFREEVEFIQVFAILPKSIGGIHKDGLNRQCGFNIPILNYEKGLMQWYDDSLQHWTHNSEYTKVRIAMNTENAVPLFSTTVEQPSLVNTNIWHRMNNADSDNYRYLLSIRFTSNKSFDEMTHEFA